jgi:hypothetical protein
MRWILIVVLFYSCGKQEFPDYEEELRVEEETSEETYRAELRPLHSQFRHLKVHGVFWIKEIQFYARVVARNLPRKTRILQYVHTLGVCPAHSMDLASLVKVSGPMLIPLDGKLGSQSEGLGWFPITNEEGEYYYSESDFHRDLLKDLRSRDRTPSDYLVKLRRGEGLDLEGRTLVLYAPMAEGHVPVACGPIRKLTHTPLE